MIANRCASALTCAVWLAASAALAQPGAPSGGKDAPPTTLSPVTVKSPATPKVIERQTQSFVRSYAAAPNPDVDQIGRWRVPVCAEVWGLPQADQAAKIKARIESMAEALGLPAPRAGCKVDVEVVFTDEPQSMMNVIARRWEPLLGYYHRSDRRRLGTITHPIQAWYVTATKSEGVDIAALMSSGVPLTDVPQPVAGVADDPTNATPVGCFDRFTACYESMFRNVLIVADSKALEGEPLSLVADDIVMLALSQARSLDGCNALPSVIDRFARSPCRGRDPPKGLTPADDAYLAALYASDLGGKKRFEQSAVADRMAKILIRADAAAGAAGSPPADAKTH